MDGTINAAIANSNGGIPGLNVDLNPIGAPGVGSRKIPMTGLAGNIIKFNADREFQRATRSFPMDLPTPRMNFRPYVGDLSAGIQGKADAYDVAHIIALHKHQSNFTGGIGMQVGLMHPVEITRYDQFLKSLTPAEQQEYSNFLGIDFSKIGHAIGSAAKAVGHAVGSAATAVGHVAGKVGTAVGHGAMAVFTPIGHAVRSVALPVAHAVRDAGVLSAHVFRDTGKFAWKNLPYIAAAAALFIPGAGPGVSAAILGAIASMKASGASDQQIQDALAAQGYPSSVMDAGEASAGDFDPSQYGSGADTDTGGADDDPTDMVPDADGNIKWPDGTTYNVNTGTLTTPDGKTSHAELPGLTKSAAPKKFDWLLWGSVAAVVALAGYYLYKNKKLNFKF